MSVKRVYFLPAGRCLVDRSALNTNLLVGEMADLPIWCYLIETTDGPILVDTGMPEKCATHPDSLSDKEDDGLIVPKMTVDDVATRVLHRAGYQPGDLACIVSTHWHFDHAGGNQLFPDTPIVVQWAEYSAAMNDDSYLPECKDPQLNYQLIEGDHELVPGVRLLFTPGHAPGHQSLWIETEHSGSVLLTIDAAYTRENFEDGVPFACHNWAQAAESIRRLQELVRTEHPHVFYGHDIEQGAAWRKHPAYY